jgi:hypothetical protein
MAATILRPIGELIAGLVERLRRRRNRGR